MHKWILFLIILIAAVLRLYGLAHFPAGFNADEAALGYNAYSLLLTGRDEHGNSWPVNLESFEDFKPAGYAYLLIPVIKLFGLTELVVRVPSALWGVLAVVGIYLLTSEILSRRIGLIAAALLAISPWAIHFSRGGWETNMATTLLVFGCFWLITWLKRPKIYLLIAGGLCLILSMYTYQSARIIAPLLALGIWLFSFKHVWSQRKQVLLVAIGVIVLLVPLLKSLVTSGAASRFEGVGLLADIGPENRANELRGQHAIWDSFLVRVLHNRPFLYTVQFAQNYFDHFNGDFLFVNGDKIERNKIPETGLLYISDIVFLVGGVIYLIRNPRSTTKFIWWWLLIAPTAAAITFQTPHALRAHNMVIPLIILTAVGIEYMFNLLSKYKIPLLSLIIITYSWQVARYLHEYYVHYPQVYPQAWEYGFKELVSYVESVKNRYDKILVTDKYDQPYILFLFYSRYAPQKFQGNHQLAVRDKFNFSTVRDYDKYHFAATPWSEVRDIHSSLIVAAPEDIPEVGVNIVKTIYFPSGQPAFKIISN